MASTQELFSVLESKYRLPGGYLSRLYQIESGGGKKLYNEKSGAEGHFQFMPGTAKKMGLSDPYNLEASADAAARLAVQNRAVLQQNGVEDPDGRMLYLAHQQGAGGAVALLTNSGAPAATALSGVYKDPKVAVDAVKNNGGSPDMAAGEFANKVMGLYEGGSGKGAYAALGTSAPIDSVSSELPESEEPETGKSASRREDYATNILLNASKGLMDTPKAPLLPIPRLSAAEGGIVNIPKGFATGGAATQMDVPASESTPDYESIVNDLYAAIGRSGTGSAVNQVDETGRNYWVNSLKSGQQTASTIAPAFQAAIKGYTDANPQDELSKYIKDYQNTQLVSGLYQGLLGREADRPGIDYWKNKLGGGQSYSDIAVEMMRSPEYQALYQNDMSEPLVQEAALRTGTKTDAGGGAPATTTSPSGWKTYFGYTPTVQDYNKMLRAMLGENEGYLPSEQGTVYGQDRALAEALGNRLAANMQTPSNYGGAKTLEALITPSQVEGIKKKAKINEMLASTDSKMQSRVATARQALDDYFSEGQNKFLTTQTDWRGFDSATNKPSPGTGFTGKNIPGGSDQSKYNTFYDAKDRPDITGYLAKLQAEKNAIYTAPVAATKPTVSELAALESKQGTSTASEDMNPFDVYGVGSGTTASGLVGNEWLMNQQVQTSGVPDVATQQVQDLYDRNVGDLIAESNRNAVSNWGTSGAASGYELPGTLTLSPYPYVSTDYYQQPDTTYAYGSAFDNTPSWSWSSDYAEGGEVSFTPMFEGDTPQLQDRARTLAKQAYTDIGGMSPQQLMEWKTVAGLYNLPMSTAGGYSSYEDQMSQANDMWQRGPSRKQREQFYADGGSVQGTNMADNQNYDALITGLYGGIGRSGLGTSPNQIDQAGYNYWLDKLNSGQETADTIGSSFNTGVQNYLSSNPNDPMSTYVRGYLGNQNTAAGTSSSGAAGPTPESVVQGLYGGIGRSGLGTSPNQIDQAGYNYWLDKLNSGQETADTIGSSFNTGVQNYLSSNPNDPMSTYVQNYLANKSGSTDTTTGGTTTGGTTTGGTTTGGTTTGGGLLTTISTTPEKDALYKSMIDRVYASIGRTGSAVDQEGYNFWLGKLQRGELKPEDFNKAFYTDVNKYVTSNPEDPVSKTVLSQYDKLIQDSYKMFGRTGGIGDAVNQIDQAGYSYWMNKLKSGEITPDTFRDVFSQEGQKFISENKGDNSDTWAKAKTAYDKTYYDPRNFDPGRYQPGSTVVPSTGQTVPVRDFVVAKPTVDYSKIKYPTSGGIAEAFKKKVEHATQLEK